MCGGGRAGTRRDKKRPAGADGSVTSGCGLPPRRAAPPAGRRAPQLPGFLARPPVLLGQRRRGPGRRGSQRRFLRAGPWLQRLGRRRQRRRQRPDACGHHRPRRQALTGRAPQQPAAAMAYCARSSRPQHSAAAAVRSRAVRLRATRPSPSTPPARARARALPRSLTITPAGWFPCRPQYVGERHAPPAAHAARLRQLWRRIPRRHLHAHCDTRHSDTRALAHSSNTGSHTRSHPHSPAGTTWDNWRG